MSTYLITGATSGLGLQVALRLARMGHDHQLVLPVRNAASADVLRRALGTARVDTPSMDLASLRSVADFVGALGGGAFPRFDGVLLNAGVQAAGRLEFTADGIETTFAVNHLSHLLLAQGLVNHNQLAANATVGWTSSGTHDPHERSARMAGFRGAQYTTAARLAKGQVEPGISTAQACKDAYATAKFCEIVAARALARRHPQAATFFSFDPGLMPGTGLARQYPPAARWVWRHVLPRLAWALPGTSSTARSSALLVDLLTGALRSPCNGAYFNYTGSTLEPAAPAAEAWVERDLMEGSAELLRPFAAA